MSMQSDKNSIAEILEKLYRPGMKYEDYLKKVYLYFSVENFKNQYKVFNDETYLANWQYLLLQANDADFPPDDTLVQKYKGNSKYHFFPSSDAEIAQARRLFQAPRYPIIAKVIYNYRRRAPYPNSDKDDLSGLKNVINDESIMDNNKEIPGWVYRLPKNFSKGNDVERIYLNVRGCENVAKILDDFCNKTGCYYKMPFPVEMFDKRVDTCIIYSPKHFSDSEKQDIVQKMSPYVRKDLPTRTNDLDGKKLADGIFVAPNYSNDKLEQHVIALNSPFEVEMRGAEENRGTSRLKLSTGQVTVFEDFTSVVKKIFPQEAERKQKDLKKIIENFDISLTESKYVLTPKNGVVSQEDLISLKNLGCVNPIIQKNQNGESSGISLSDIVDNHRGLVSSILKRKSKQFQKDEKPNVVVPKDELQTSVDDVLNANDIYQNPETGLVGFVPKKGVSKMDAYETLSKLKVFGFLLSLSAPQKDGSRLFVADPKAKDSKNAAIIDILKKAVNQKGK